MTARKPKRVRTAEFSTRHTVWVVIGTDGSLISEPYWHKEHADDYCPDGCHVRAYWLHMSKAPGAYLSPPPKRKRK